MNSLSYLNLGDLPSSFWHNRSCGSIGQQAHLGNSFFMSYLLVAIRPITHFYDWLFSDHKYNFRILNLKKLFDEYTIEDNFSRIVCDI